MPDTGKPTPAPFFSDVDDGPEGGAAYWLSADDGLRLRIAVWPHAAPKGTVLMFPGRTEYAEKYGRTARDLAARGYAMLSVDWRGQGIADRTSANPLKGDVARFSDYQRDVRAVTAAAEALNLPKPWHLIGHSMGGCIGLRALHEGLPVASAAFTGPMWGMLLPPPARPVAWTLAAVGTLTGFGKAYVPGTVRDAYVLIKPFEDNNLTNDPDMYEYMIRQTRAHPEIALAGPTLRWLYGALRETVALAKLPAPPQPCLTFYGTDEAIVDVPAIVAQMDKWDNGTLETLDGGRHEVLMDTPEMRARIFDAMAAHFDRHG